MQKLRFGLVGCGVIHDWHAQVLANLKDEAQLVAVCDVVPERAQKSADKWGADAHTDYAEMLAREDIDAVGIGTPSGMHVDMALAAVRAGKHVVVEKPVDVSLSKADELVKAARDAKVTLTVISQNRYGKGIRQLHRWLDEGKLGKLIYGEAVIKWYRSQDYYDSGDWRGTWALDGGGALMNQGVHYADQLRWAMGKPKNVFARAKTAAHERIEVEDILTANFEFENGALGTLTASTSMLPGFETGLEVYGTEGSVRIKDNELVIAKFKDGTTVKPDDLKTETVGGSDPAAIGYYLHTQQFQDFLAAVREGRDPWITGEIARDALELVIGVYQSAKSGQIVNFPLPADTGRGDQ